MATSNNNANAASNSSFASLLGCTMESIIHELLYSRAIYPLDSFVHHRHLSVRFHCSRVPQVCDYISNFLKIAIPSVIGGVGDSISLIILEEEVANLSTANGNGTEEDGQQLQQQQQRIGTTKILERFVFQFQMDSVIYGEDKKPRPITLASHDGGSMMQHEAMKRDTELAMEAKSQMERSMRDCLLQVLTLRGRRKSKNENAENLSFKLCLHVAGEDGKKVLNSKIQQQPCPELMNALKHGEWFQPEQSSCVTGSNLVRPIRNVNVPSCGIKMTMGFYSGQS
jgi:hypothetical protein